MAAFEKFKASYARLETAAAQHAETGYGNIDRAVGAAARKMLTDIAPHLPMEAIAVLGLLGNSQ